MRLHVERRVALARWVLVVGGALGILFVLCAGAAFWGFRSIRTEMPAAEASAGTFLTDLQGGRIDAAYLSTTSGFRSAVTKEQFTKLTSSVPLLTSHQSRSLRLNQMHLGTGGGRAVFTVDLRGPAGNCSCTLTLNKEGGGWKVHHLNVPMTALPGIATTTPKESGPEDRSE